MTSPRHADPPPCQPGPGDHAALETFTVPFPRRLFSRLFGCNPLLRASDRVEALLLVLAVAVSLFTVPIAAAIGTAVHDSRSRLYAEQVQTRRPVTATVVGDSRSPRKFDSRTVQMPARWDFAGAERTGDIAAPPAAKVGDDVEIWVDGQGSPVTRPDLSPRDQAVTIAVAIWCAVSLTATASFAGAQHALDRARYAGWQRDFDRVIGQR